jgi:hypothetical protein
MVAGMVVRRPHVISELAQSVISLLKIAIFVAQKDSIAMSELE